MLVQVATQSLEVRLRALARHKARLHQLARGIIHEDQQGAGLGTILEPVVFAPVDLHQLAIGLATKPWLVKHLALLAGEPHAVGHHPAPKRLAAYVDHVSLCQSLGSQRGTEIGVVSLHQLDRERPDAWVVTPVRRAASGLVHQPEPAVLLIPRQQPVCLTLTDTNKEAAAATVRLPDCTSFRTSTRLTSRSLILVHAILRT